MGAGSDAGASAIASASAGVETGEATGAGTAATGAGSVVGNVAKAAVASCLAGAAGIGTRRSRGNVTRVSGGKGSSAGNVTLVQADNPHAATATIHTAENGGRPRFRLVTTVSRLVSGRWACIMLSDSLVFFKSV